MIKENWVELPDPAHQPQAGLLRLAHSLHQQHQQQHQHQQQQQHQY